MGLPPKSKRFCVMCEKETLWAYNRNIGHSSCNECGGHYGTDPNSYFTTVFKQKIKADQEVRRLEKEKIKIRENYIKMFEIIFENKDLFSKEDQEKIKRLYKIKK